jgi:hypothetical protein
MLLSKFAHTLQWYFSESNVLHLVLWLENLYNGYVILPPFLFICRWIV